MSLGPGLRTVTAATCAISAAALLMLIYGPITPVAAGDNAKSRGAEIFATAGCVHCHGVAGLSGGKGPSLAEVRKRRTPEAMYQQIHEGGKSMPAFGDQLTEDQIKDLIQYLRSKRKAPQ